MGQVSISFRGHFKNCFIYINFNFVLAKALECYKCPYYDSWPYNTNCKADTEDNGVVMTCPENPYGDKMACFSTSISGVGNMKYTALYDDTPDLNVY